MAEEGAQVGLVEAGGVQEGAAGKGPAPSTALAAATPEQDPRAPSPATPAAQRHLKENDRYFVLD